MNPIAQVDSPENQTSLPDNGLLYLTEHVNAMFSCKVIEKKDLGSHMMFVGEVTESKVLSNTPLLYLRALS